MANCCQPRSGAVDHHHVTINKLYIKLERRLSLTTVRHVHRCRACLATAMRKGILVRNPVDGADIPKPEDESGRASSCPDEIEPPVRWIKGRYSARSHGGIHRRTAW